MAVAAALAMPLALPHALTLAVPVALPVSRGCVCVRVCVCLSLSLARGCVCVCVPLSLEDLVNVDGDFFDDNLFTRNLDNAIDRYFLNDCNHFRLRLHVHTQGQCVRA